MTTNKKSQKPAAGKTAPSKTDPARELAGLISAVLAHPDTPEAVYYGVVDGLNEMWNSTELWEDPRAVAAVLDYHAARNARRKGGAS